MLSAFQRPLPTSPFASSSAGTSSPSTGAAATRFCDFTNSPFVLGDLVKCAGEVILEFRIIVVAGIVF